MATTRVLWVIKGLGPGGAERLLVESARFVDTDRFTYEAVYLLPWKDQLAGELADAGVPVTCLDVPRVADPRWAGRLRHLIRDRQFDVVHAHLPTSAIGARLAVRSLGAPRPAMVYTEHNRWDRLHPVTRTANAMTFGLNDRAIAVSRSVKSSMRPRAAKRTKVIPNGVDVAGLRSVALDRSAARERLGVAEDAVVIGTVGGITPKKGHLTLVQAAARVVRQFPEVRFVCVGLPVEMEPVTREVHRLGLGETVRFAGYEPKAATLMRAFDVYCLPSRFEGMPLSLIEAMALGVPAVATRVGGTPEVVTDGSDGVLVPSEDPEALANGLLGLLRDHERAAGLATAAKTTAERFDLATMVRSVERTYDDALAQRRRR